MNRASPPRPELDADVAREPAGEEVEHTPFAAINLGRAGHVGLELEAGILQPRDDGDGSHTWTGSVLFIVLADGCGRGGLSVSPPTTRSFGETRRRLADARALNDGEAVAYSGILVSPSIGG